MFFFGVLVCFVPKNIEKTTCLSVFFRAWLWIQCLLPFGFLLSLNTWLPKSIETFWKKCGGKKPYQWRGTTTQCFTGIEGNFCLWISCINKWPLNLCAGSHSSTRAPIPGTSSCAKLSLEVETTLFFVVWDMFCSFQKITPFHVGGFGC